MWNFFVAPYGTNNLLISSTTAFRLRFLPLPPIKRALDPFFVKRWMGSYFFKIIVDFLFFYSKTGFRYEKKKQTKNYQLTAKSIFFFVLSARLLHWCGGRSDANGRNQKKKKTFPAPVRACLWVPTATWPQQHQTGLARAWVFFVRKTCFFIRSVVFEKKP